MNIVVKEELRAYIDPLTPEEHNALERSILAEGCRDALVLWGEVLVDGHNRYGICSKHGLPFNTVQNTRFQSMDDVHLWMIDQHLGRRSVSDFQRGVLALRKKDILAQRQAQARGADPAQGPAASGTSEGNPEEGATAAVTPAERLNTREAIARAARISSTTVSQIEKIQKAAAPELVAAVKAGEVSINAAAVVASLPLDDQLAAVAGGKKQLQQVARQVREAKAGSRPPKTSAPVDEGREGAQAEPLEDESITPALVAQLRQTIAALQAENAALKARLATLA